MSYENFARFYDGLQTDVDYERRTGYLLKLFEKFDRIPGMILDVACGTGGFSLQFAEKDIDVTGVDPSPEMLGVLREKLDKCGKNMLLVCQSAAELDLYGTYDGAVCCLDSLNHITDKNEFRQSIERIALFLERGRLFIFDLNTEYKHREVLSGKSFVTENEDVFCVWRNSICDADGIVNISLDFFSENADGSYFRSSEDFSERAYSSDFVSECITNAGLKTVAILGDLSDKTPENNEERVIYVTRRV